MSDSVRVLVTGSAGIDQSPTWQEYYFRAHRSHHPYTIESFPGGHAVYLTRLSKEGPGDFVRIENSMFTNCGSNCVVYQQSNVDMRIANCVIDGGYLPWPATNDSSLADWRGNCIVVGLPLIDRWNKFPVIEIVQNELTARGWDAWGARLYGCGHGEDMASKEGEVLGPEDAVPREWLGGLLAYYQRNAARSVVVYKPIMFSSDCFSCRFTSWREGSSARFFHSCGSALWS